MNYVLDCSFTSSLFLPDESSDSTRLFFIKLKSSDVIFVPSLWWHETANVLKSATKRKRLNFNETLGIIDLIEKLPLQTDGYCGFQHSKEIFKLAQMYDLSSYDATYLELAIRTKSKLLSHDKEINSVSFKIGLK
mgnify:CR=1 FL=1